MSIKILKPKVCCIGDLHIGSHCDSPMWHKIILDYARWLSKRLKELDIKDIFMLGDINNNRNEISVLTLHVVPQFFEILRDFNIVLIVGNHDSFYNKTTQVHSLGSLENWSNISIIDKPTTITAFEKTITFCPWETPTENIPISDLVFGHFEITTFKMHARHICENGTNANELLARSPFIMTGHFHLPEIRKYEKGVISYVGCPYELSWNDHLSQKYFSIVDLEKREIERIPNDFSPKHIKITLSELKAIGVTDKIRKEFKNNIVNFCFDEFDVDPSVVEKIIQKLALLEPLQIHYEYLQKGLEVVDTESISFTGVDIENTLIEYINLLESVENKEEVIKYILDVYSRIKSKIVETADTTEDETHEE